MRGVVPLLIIIMITSNVDCCTIYLLGEFADHPWHRVGLYYTAEPFTRARMAASLIPQQFVQKRPTGSAGCKFGQAPQTTALGCPKACVVVAAV